MLEVIEDNFTLPTLDDELEFDEDNFDDLITALYLGMKRYCLTTTSLLVELSGTASL